MKKKEKDKRSTDELYRDWHLRSRDLIERTNDRQLSGKKPNLEELDTWGKEFLKAPKNWR